MLVRVGGPGARVVGGGVVEPGVGAVAGGVGGGVRVLLARRLWAVSLGSHRRTVFQIGGGAPHVAWRRRGAFSLMPYGKKWS